MGSRKALREFWGGPVWSAARLSGDPRRQVYLITAHLQSAEDSADLDLLYRSLVHAFCFYAKQGAISCAAEVSERLAVIAVPAEQDRLAILAARWSWETLDDPRLTRLFLERAGRHRVERAAAADAAGPADPVDARFARQEDAWHEFLETSIHLGLACREKRPDREIEALIWHLRSFIGLGNLSQACFLKSLRCLEEHGRFVHSARYLQAWVWADQLRAERLQGFDRESSANRS